MSENKRFSRQSILFLAQIISFEISVCSILFIPLAYSYDNKKCAVISNIIATVFWGGLLLGIVLTFVIKSEIKRFMVKIDMSRKRIPGIARFFSNTESKISCIAFGCFMSLAVSDLYFNYMSEICLVIIVMLTLNSFYIHCIVDGFNYRCYKLLKKGIKINDNKIGKTE